MSNRSENGGAMRCLALSLLFSLLGYSCAQSLPSVARTGRQIYDAEVLNNFARLLIVSNTRVADHEIAKPALTPCFHVERQFLGRKRIIIQTGWQ